MAETFTETLHAGYAQTMTLKGKMLVDEQSPFQNVKFFDTERNEKHHADKFWAWALAVWAASKPAAEVSFNWI